MALDPETFEYLKPTEMQMLDMRDARDAARMYANALNRLIPDGPDKTYVLRKLREIAMWVNVAITRNPDGSPRQGREVNPKDYPADHPVKGDLGSIPL